MTTAARAMWVALMIVWLALLPVQVAAQSMPPLDSQHCPPVARCGAFSVPVGCECDSQDNFQPPPLPAPPGCDRLGR